jgi:signal peptide peptidase SppA
MKRQLILGALASQYWALEPKYLETMSNVLHRWSAGVEASADVMADVEAAQAARAARQKAVANLGGGIAVLGLYGLISQRASMVDGMSGSGGTSVEKFTQGFREAMADDTVGGIIIDIDSPGGSVAGIQDLWDEIMGARGVKPVYGLVNSLCASAAYWIGSACAQMYAVQGSQVGSIGVYTQHVDASEAMKMEGLNATYISAGKFKVEGNELGPLSEEGRAFTQSQIDAYYTMFTGAVAKGRSAPIGQVRDGMGQGRCLMAADGLAAGMVDGIDTFDSVVKRMSKAMKASGASAAAPVLDIAAIDLPAPVAVEVPSEPTAESITHRIAARHRELEIAAL